MDQGENTQRTGALTGVEGTGTQRGACWDALRANAIGSLWGRSAVGRAIGHGDLWALRADTLR